MLNSQAVAEPASASSGRIAPFGKYLLLQRVSVGGMAEVFKALPAGAEHIDQIVAIKRILPNIAKDGEFIGMFIDEARIAGQLTHPNICRIYELGRVGNDHYIAMQFLWGRDLLKVMNRYKKAGRLVSPSMAAFIGAKALSALHYAHTKSDKRGQPLNIIHRDVSPQNIIVGYSGQVKLIDFGVARAATQSQKTQAGILKGKFGYMSPEMIRGLPIDHRSDVFAMGICLHELLTSSRLFYGETDFATLELVRDAKVAPPSHKAPGIPAALDAIVMRALSREVSERYQSAGEMQLALEHFLATYDPQYGEADVGMAMRQAFHTEVQRERERLELYLHMLERGELVRGAIIPAPAQPGEAGRRSTPPVVGALIDGATPPPREPPPLADDLQEEQTHIFFSVDELDEIRDLERSPEQRGPTRHPTLSELVPPPPPESEALTTLPPPGAIAASPSGASGTYQRQSDAGTPPPHPFERSNPFDRPNMFDAPFEPAAEQSGAVQAMASTAAPALMHDPPEHELRRPRPKRGLGRYGVYAALGLTLGIAAYAVPHFARSGTGTLEVESVGDPDALVRVDGIVRGNPPVVVEGLTPGRHQVEVEATGFEVARAEVQVAEGKAQSVKLTLDKPTTEPSVAGLAHPPTAPGAGAPQPAPAPKRERPRAHKPEGRQGEAASEREPNEEAVASETQVGESFDQALAAANEGQLLISTVPWSHVFIDGVDTGRDTPVRALRVPAGAHKVELRTDDGAVHAVDVTVKAGQVVRIIRRF